MSKKAAKLVLFCDQLKSTKSDWDSHWDDVIEYAMPHRNRVYDRSTGDQRGHRVYDSTPQHFVELLASALHSMLTNPSVQWFGLGLGIPELDRKTANLEYIQKMVTMVHDALNATNFQTEIHELYLDIASLGTGCMFIEEDKDDLLRFLTIPIFEVDIAENSKGIVDTACRRIKMTGHQLLEKYGKAIPDKKKQEILKALDDKFEVSHLIMPREKVKTTKLDALNKPFASYHILMDGQILLKESGYDQFPYVIPRWTKLAGEVYGRSPAMKTLPDIKMLNQMMKTVIRAGQKAVDPPYLLAHDSVLGRLNLGAGGVTAARHGMLDGVKSLHSGARVDIGMEIVNQVRLNVKQGFFIDQLQLGGSDRMTELEVGIRNDENLRLMSPILGRLHNEMLDKLVGRVMGVMLKRGEMPKNTPLDIQENQLKMHYRSQIAKAQTANEGRILTGFVGDAIQMAEQLQKPEILDGLDFNEILREKARLDGVNVSIFKSEEDTDETREQRGQFEANKQNLQVKGAEAEIAAKQKQALE